MWISTYMPLLEGHISHNAWPASGQIILKNLQANLDKKMLQWLAYQEYYAEDAFSPAKGRSLCRNSQHHQHREKRDCSQLRESSLFCNKIIIHILAVIIHILKVRYAIPCEASGTRTKSFAHQLASRNHETVESCMQQVIIMTNVQPTYLRQNWSNVTIMPENNWPDQIFISMTTDRNVQKCS